MRQRTFVRFGADSITPYGARSACAVNNRRLYGDRLCGNIGYLHDSSHLEITH
jgi:hypothetical protein